MGYWGGNGISIQRLDFPPPMVLEVIGLTTSPIGCNYPMTIKLMVLHPNHPWLMPFTVIRIRPTCYLPYLWWNLE